MHVVRINSCRHTYIHNKIIYKYIIEIHKIIFYSVRTPQAAFLEDKQYKVREGNCSLNLNTQEGKDTQCRLTGCISRKEPMEELPLTAQTLGLKRVVKLGGRHRWNEPKIAWVPLPPCTV